MTADLLIKHCRLYLHDRTVDCDLLIDQGKVVARLAPGTGGDARQVIDAAGRPVIPGVIDTHVHMANGPQSFEDDCWSESRAAVTGGVTTFCPFIIGQGYRELLPRYIQAVKERGFVDMAFHLAIVNPEEQTADIPYFAQEFGIKSFKVFMAYKRAEVTKSGIRGIDDGEIVAVFAQVAKVPGAVGIIHCENMEVIEHFQKPLIAAGRDDLSAWTEGRPIFGELEAIRRAITWADYTGASLLIPHVGIGTGSEFLRQKHWGKAKVHIETCPHYLLLEQHQDLHARGKVNPPVRDREQIDALWQRLTDGTIDVMGSDHCPFQVGDKVGTIWQARPGLTTGMTMILPVLLSEGVHKRGLSLNKVVELTSYNAARKFGLAPRKGTLDIGSDADLVMLDMEKEQTITASMLNSVSDWTPYEGYRCKGWPAMTLVRGQVCYKDGEVTGQAGHGQYLPR